MRSEVLTATSMAFFWDDAPRSLVDIGRLVSLMTEAVRSY
jgi:hypothetical protein